MDPWYKVVSPRKEVREGRSFNPDEFAIHLEQVVAGTAPEDSRDPAAFFARTCFTRALREHLGTVLRRLAGRTENAAPVLTLITPFGVTVKGEAAVILEAELRQALRDLGLQDRVEIEGSGPEGGPSSGEGLESRL